MELIERLEALSGPVRATFIEVYNACYSEGGTPWASDACHRERFMFLIHWEAYLEAAYMLIPKGGWMLLRNHGGPQPLTRDLFEADVLADGGKDRPVRWSSLVADPAIALCIAALRARSADNG